MAHQIDFSHDRANIAFSGEVPWHRLGQQLTPGQGMEVWAKEAGLDHEVFRAPVQVETEHGKIAMPSRHLLYRSDTLAPLAIVGADYNIVQPGEILEFFSELADLGGFEMEVAGCLSGGKRVWALARVNDGAPIIGHDIVRPYLLLATSYDTTLATTAKFTVIRVVCNNTITMALGNADTPKTESDTEGRAVNTMVRIQHTQRFDKEQVRRDLGIAASTWDRWLIRTKLLAEEEMTRESAEQFLVELLPEPSNEDRVVQDTRAFQNIMTRFEVEDPTKWMMLNAVTGFVDHDMGRSDDTRVNSAWFGAGDRLKSRAYDLLAA